ncbi:hypothetical protein [Kitasatospora sp. NPDC088351]|uniref:hypothetical protein n=1 Tax=unclassified Kitasatospora TaxID=2633591 RepID=UPI00341CEB51
MADKESSVQVLGAAVVVMSALAVVAAYLINGAALVLMVAGVEVLLLMVYVARRWQALRRPAVPRGHRPAGGTPDAAHCERCRRAREALDARQARSRERSAPQRSVPGRPVPERPFRDRPAPERFGRERPAPDWTAERAAARSLDRSTARDGVPGSAGRAVRHQ